MNNKQLSILQMCYDSNELISLMRNLKHDSISSIFLVPYYSLFCIESLSILSNYGIDITSSFNCPYNQKTIRAKLKCFEEKYNKSINIVRNCDFIQDYIFKNKLKCTLPKKLNMYYNIGIFIYNNKIIGNSQYSYYIFQDSKALKKSKLSLNDLQFELIPSELKEYGAYCGNIISKINIITNEVFKLKPNFDNNSLKPNICFKDLNTNKIFKKETKTEYLYLLHILSNINYVYYVLKLYEEDNGWWIKLYYITYYYSLRRILNLTSYLKNNNIKLDKIEILEDLYDNTNKYINPDFRSCVMHYDFYNHINKKYFDVNKPLFGLIESSFNGINYDNFKNEILTFIKQISDTLEKYLNIDISNNKPLIKGDENINGR